MKKFFLFASAALVLASCSSEAEEAVIKPNETPEEEVLELTEIKLGAGAPTVSAETRAAVPVDNWNDTPVGIFGVNENANATGDNKWDVVPDRNDMEITVENAVILRNEPATVAAPSTGGAVTFTNANANKIYFPRGNSKNYGYTFLGYYPYIDNDPTVSENSIAVSGKFDGTQDIMAGKAESATPLDNGNNIGYNAKYIREYRAQESNEPNINIAFEHKTSKIDIYLQQTTNYNPEMCKVYAAWFEVPETYTLTFAKPTSGNGVTTTLEFRDGPVNAYAIGGGDFSETKDYKENDIVRHDDGSGPKYYIFTSNHDAGQWTGGDADDFDAVEPENGTQDVPHTIFVNPEPVANSGTTTKTLHLVLNDDPSRDITVNVPSPQGGFEKGKAYKVYVTIHGPEEIKVTASITEWVTGGTVPPVEI